MQDRKWINGLHLCNALLVEPLAFCVRAFSLEIPRLFDEISKKLLKAKPDDPIPFILQVLSEKKVCATRPFGAINKPSEPTTTSPCLFVR